MNDFEKLVSEMRNAQKKYFKTRDAYWLRKSKELESAVDVHLSNINQPSLDL